MYTHDNDADGESCSRVNSWRRRRQARELVMDGANDFERRTSLTGVVRTDGNGEKAFIGVYDRHTRTRMRRKAVLGAIVVMLFAQVR